MNRSAYNTTAYRYPRERLILMFTLLLVFLVIALTATATVCLSAVFVLVMVAISYGMSRSQHKALLARGRRITSQRMPRLAALFGESVARLQVGQVQAFVSPGDVLNAYTFGLTPPKVVVLQSALLEVMDETELRFIIGHELGHVRLGHTWLNSLVGGMAGTPSPFAASILLTMAFLWWNRACEYSADRAGLLACGNAGKAVSALVRLAAGKDARTVADLERAVRLIEAEDDRAVSNLNEALSTHPMMVRRIERLRDYAGSAQCRRLQPLLDNNVATAQGAS